MQGIKSLTDFSDSFYSNKKILIRVDFNVKVIDGLVSEDYRIRSTMSTIEYLVKRGAKIILISHLDRPKGKNKRYSLLPVSKKLSEILSPFNIPVHFSHRKHSSTYGTVKFFDTKIIGFNVAKEIEYLSLLRDNPPEPFKIVIGGVKIKDKIGALNNLLPKASRVLIGGAASYTFLKAKGISVGDSIVDEEYLSWASKALNNYDDKIVLPMDHKVSISENSLGYKIIENNIPPNMKGFDIGDKTLQKFIQEIHNNVLGAIFWNGPMGFFEKEIFSYGTKSIALSMALAYWRGVKTLIGGGDTLEAMKVAGVSEKEVTHVSTGGGASLRFLAGDEMPGIDILKN
jgi:phosphoglycerate kinase